MFKIEINATPVIMTKFFGTSDKDNVLAAIPDGTRRVVFIDTPATDYLVATIGDLISRGVEVVVRDHHDVPAPRNPREQEIAAAANRVRELVGSNAMISDRATHPACSGLIEIGEFNGEGTVLVVDPDPDGLTAAMKAVGVVYDGIDADAAVLDGPHSGQNADTLSPTGFLLVQGMATLPPFNKDRPQASEDAKSKLFANFAAAVTGNEAAMVGLQSKVAEYNAQVAVALDLVKTAEPVVVDKVCAVDIRGKIPHIGTLAAELDKSWVVTVLIKGDGPIAKACGGAQYSLSVRKADQTKVNLQALLPEGFESSPAAGIISNTSFLLHVSENVWNETVLPALTVRLGV